MGGSVNEGGVLGRVLWNEHVEIPHEGYEGRDQVWSYDWASKFMLPHRRPSTNLSNPKATQRERERETVQESKEDKKKKTPKDTG